MLSRRPLVRTAIGFAILLAAPWGAAAVGAPYVLSSVVTILGTADPNVIVIDENAGTATLDGAVVATFDGAEANAFYVYAEGGSDSITVIDSGDSDVYLLDAGQFEDDIADMNSIEITDGHNHPSAIQRYHVRFGRSQDTLIIDDSGLGQQEEPFPVNYDLYDVMMGGDLAHRLVTRGDSATVTDGQFLDVYALNGDGFDFSEPSDELTINDSFEDGTPVFGFEPRDVVGIVNWESVTGSFK